MIDRFVANKFGILNFWYYYDLQEFKLENGKIIFRGNNGSGKSVTTQSFIPLLLDGNKNPSRLDPFGTKSRQIGNYLIMNEDDEDRIAYLYIEFKKPSSDIYITIGMGLRAKKGKSGVESWYFILKDGRRINKDLKLYKRQQGEDYPLTAKEFKNKLLEDNGINVFTENQSEYMRKVNEHLYGYSNIDDYKDLLNLLIQLRSPKLSKDFKPTVIYEILESSLSTLSDEDLRPMAEAMDNMDSLNEGIQDLEKSLSIIRNLKKEFDNYNKYVLYKKGNNFKNAKDELNTQKNKLKNLEYDLEIKQNNIKEKESELENLERIKKNAEIKSENLKNSEVFKIRKDINTYNTDLEKLQNTLEIQKNKYNEKVSKLRKIEEKIDDLDKKNYKNNKNLEGLLLDEKNLSQDAYFHPINKIDKNELDKEYNFNFLIEEINNFKILVDDIYNDILKYKNKYENLSNLEKNIDLISQNIKIYKHKLENSQEYLTNIKTELTEKINIYIKDTTELKLKKDTLDEIFSKIYDIKNKYEYSKIMDIIKSVRDILHEEFLNKKLELENKLKSNEENKTSLEKEIENLKSLKEIFDEENDYLETKKILDENNINYEVFYKTIKFKETIDINKKKIIEKSLLKMGILNSFIIAKEDKKKVLELLNKNTYKILSESDYLNQNIDKASSIYKYFDLENSDFNRLYKDEIINILYSIKCKDIKNSSTYIDENYGYKIGIINGKVDANYILKYIGSTSREEYRIKQIESIQNKMNDIQISIENLKLDIKNIENRDIKLQTEINNFPNDKDIIAAIELIEEDEERLNSEESKLVYQEEEHKKCKNEFEKIKRILFDKTNGINLPLEEELYKELRTNIETYKSIIDDIKEVHKQILNNNKQRELLKNNEDDLNDDIETIDLEKSSLILEIKNKNESIKSLEEVLNTLGAGKVDKEMEIVTKILSTYPDKIQSLKSEIVRLDEKINNDSHNIKYIENIVYEKQNIASICEEVFYNELRLNYIESLQGLSGEEALTWILKNVKQYKNEKINISERIYSIIANYEHELTDYNMKKILRFDDYKETENKVINDILKDAIRVDLSFKFNQKWLNIYKLETTLNYILETNKLLISKQERQVFEDILLNTISTKVSAKIGRAKSWVKSINTLMNEMDTSNGLKLSLKWEPKKSDNEEELDTKKLVELFRKSQFITENDKTQISNHFKSQLKNKKRDLLNEGSFKSYGIIIKEILDYRTWFEFKLLFLKDNKNKEMTNNEFFRLSGGEKAMSMYVPLFAAVNARYDSADKKDCPRIISLDEAFAGVDEQNIYNMFKLVESLDLDYVLNSQVLWGTYDSVKSLAIYELTRGGKDIVIPIRYTWNGKEKILDI